MLSKKEYQKISVLLAESLKNRELKSPDRRSAGRLFADFDTVYHKRT